MTTADEKPQGSTATTATPAAGGAGKPGPEQIQAEIEQTRQELSETVDALSAKFDVKTKAKERIGSARDGAEQRLGQVRVRAATLTARTKDAATDDQGRLQPAVPIGLAVGAATIVTVLLWRHRHR